MWRKRDVLSITLTSLMLVLLLLYGAYIVVRNICFTRTFAPGVSRRPRRQVPAARLLGQRHAASFLLSNADKISQNLRKTDADFFEQIMSGVTELHVDVYVELRDIDERARRDGHKRALVSEDGRRRCAKSSALLDVVCRPVVCYVMANGCPTEYNLLDALDKLAGYAAAERFDVRVWLFEVETAWPTVGASRRDWLRALTLSANEYLASIGANRLSVRWIDDSADFREPTRTGIHWMGA